MERCTIDRVSGKNPLGFIGGVGRMCRMPQALIWHAFDNKEQLGSWFESHGFRFLIFTSRGILVILLAAGILCLW